MKGVDLALFAFDFDLTLAAVMLEPDGTVLGRWDGRVGAELSTDDAMPSLAAALEEALALHARLDSVRPALAGKRGPPPTFRRAEEIPAPSIRKALGRAGEKGCIHCHQLYEHEDALVARRADYAPLALAKHPSPETIGLGLDSRDGRTVAAVREGSPASAAGVRAGDVVAALGGQPIVSLADVRFVLHHQEAESALAIELRRGAATVTAVLALSGPWKADDFSWRSSMYPMPPAPGLWVVPLPDDDDRRRTAGLAGRLALEVRGVFGEAAKKAGLLRGDVIVAADGRTAPMTERAFHAWLRLNHFRPGSVLDLGVLREGRPAEVKVRF